MTVATIFLLRAICKEKRYGKGSPSKAMSVIMLITIMEVYCFVGDPQLPGIVRSQFRAIGRHMANVAMMLATLHVMRKAPIHRAHRRSDSWTNTLVYMDKTDSLLKHTVTFQSIGNTMMP